jgi:N-acetylmuramoyl-L-alanine amidase
MCTINGKGDFTPDTVIAAQELVEKLIKENHLTIDDVGTHYAVVGWKDCPRLWFNNPEKFEEFKEGVKRLI